MRSILLVSPSDAASIDAASRVGADALVLDLVSAPVDGGARAHARLKARDILRAAQVDPHRPHLYVRLDGPDHEAFDDDLAAIMVGEPDGIVLANSRSGRDVQQLGARLAVGEAEYGLADGETGIIAEAGATAGALFQLGTYPEASPRLTGLTWHPERLMADLGSDHDASDPGTHAPAQLMRHMTLFAARAAEVTAIDVAGVPGDGEAFQAACLASRRLGYNAMLTASPAQVAIINAVFARE